MVYEITGVRVLSLHHDISTITGEEIVLFLVESLIFRETKETMGPRPNARFSSGVPNSSPTMPCFALGIGTRFC